MADDIQTLRDLAQRASDRHDGKRGRALGREAAKHGLSLSYTTTDKILNGKYYSTPKRETVDALAMLAAVPKEVAYEVAGIPAPSAPFAEQLPPDVDTLSQEQRRVLVDLARVFVKQNRHVYELEAGNAAQAEDEAGSDQGVPGTGDRAPMTEDELAARRGDPAPPLRGAADDTPSEGKRARRRVDEVGEESQ